MITGIGIDIEKIDRIERIIERWGQKFLDRIFTKGEQTYCLKRVTSSQSFAARFAAKEACMKALGTGFSRGVRWLDIEVVRPPGQPPAIKLHGRSKEIADSIGLVNISLTITHSDNFSHALVIFETD